MIKIRIVGKKIEYGQLFEVTSKDQSIFLKERVAGNENLSNYCEEVYYD